MDITRAKAQYDRKLYGPVSHHDPAPFLSAIDRPGNGARNSANPDTAEHTATKSTYLLLAARP